MEDETLANYLESDEFVKATVNATRLVGKLKSSMQGQELYETHQILRTIYFRFINAKDKLRALEKLLYHGACFLLKLHEYVSGQDVATLFLESAAKCLQYHRDEGGEEAKRDLSDPSTSHHLTNKTLDCYFSQKVSNIAISLPESEIGQSKFISDALRILNPKLVNRSLLHNVLANNFWQHKDFVNSRYHYLHCASMENALDIARFLVDYQMTSATKSEVDLFITQFIFQLLCLQYPIDLPKSSNRSADAMAPPSFTLNRRTRACIKSIAGEIFSAYTLNHPLKMRVCAPYTSLPLLNFTYFIISIIDSDQEACTFRMLCDIYRLTWTRDPNYKGYLTRIGALYFGIVDETKQRQSGGAGFFNNILQSLMEGAEEDENDSNQERSNSSSSDELD